MEAKIVRLEKMLVIGMQTFGGNAADFPKMWDLLSDVVENIPNRVDEKVVYGIETYTKDIPNIKHWFYMAGVEVESIDNLDVSLSAKLIPANDYACFEYRGAISEKLGEYFQKIYHEWLPSSGLRWLLPMAWKDTTNVF